MVAHYRVVADPLGPANVALIYDLWAFLGTACVVAVDFPDDDYGYMSLWDAEPRLKVARVGEIIRFLITGLKADVFAKQITQYGLARVS